MRSNDPGPEGPGPGTRGPVAGVELTLLAGQTALVTGASRGIGRATALRLAAAGARVIAHFGSSQEAAESLAAGIRRDGGRVDLVRSDLSKPDAAQSLAAQVRRLGVERLDILVSNAGVGSVRTLEAQTLDEFDRHYAINVRTPYFLVQQCLPFLLEGSRVIFVSSTTARSAPVGASLYASTKGAINTLVRCLAAELGPRGIRVNAVAPGAIETDMASFLKIEAARQAVIAEQALKRVGQADDVADAIVALASSDSRWISGQVIEVSGGTRL